jgi:hypothetical protein
MDIIRSGNHYYYLHAPDVRVSDEDCKRCHISNKDVKPRCNAHCKCCPNRKSQTVTNLIESIALQETELAHILNLEGERIQKGISLATNIDELISLDCTVKQTLTNVIKIQMLLQFALEEIASEFNKKVSKNGNAKILMD